MKKIWFNAKDYGWGWYPVTWQGWLVLAVFIILMFLRSWDLDSESSSENDFISKFLLQTFFLVAILIYICYKTGERPRWRWGGKDLTRKK
ncbi:MAG: hypothetical protein NTU97_02695 [Candidatus Magasanikbacteria bacterium]|nr:hypothetical protein [Candidatus Magasanikbacteria bacterium]